MKLPTQWISVEDRLPEVDGWYMIFIPHDIYASTVCTAFRRIGFDDWAIFNGGHTTYATHWMPLPDPPEVQP